MDSGSLTLSNFTCCCGSHHCQTASTHQQVVKELKQDLKVAAQAGMQLLRQSQESEDLFKSQIEEIGAENARLSRQNSELVSDFNARAQQHIEAQQKAADLEIALASAQSHAQQLKSYHTLALALEEQVTALETLRASLEKERDTAVADAEAYERRWRASETLATSVQTAYNALEAAVAQQTPMPLATATSTAPPTPREVKFRRHGILTPAQTPDVSLDDSLAAELAAFDLRPKLRRAASHESVFAPLQAQRPALASTFGPLSTTPAVSTAAPEVVVVRGVRSGGHGKGSARAFLGSVRR